MTVRLRTRAGVVPLGSLYVVLLGVLFSLLFIFSISLAFVGASKDEASYLGSVLADVAKTGSGIVLLGESVDVDVDEPAVTVRWSLIACGAGLMLPQSPPVHGSTICGLPTMPLEIFVDSSKDPVYTYDPELVPFDLKTGQRKIVQRLIEFDSDHVLDVHTQRLYPFDTYLLSTVLRASSTNSSFPASMLPLLALRVTHRATNFDIDVTGIASDAGTPTSSEQDPADGAGTARYIALRISRPADARVYALLLFGINWMLSHFNFGVVLLATYRGRLRAREGTGADKEKEKERDVERGVHFGAERERKKAVARAPSQSKDALKQLAGVLAIILVIPQLRDAMPDAPGFDGVLLDTIGFFPQMALAGISAIFLLLITAKRELEHNSEEYTFSFPAGFMSFAMPRGFHQRQLTKYS